MHGLQESQGRLSGKSIIDAVHRSGVQYILSVPDITTSEGLLFPLASDKRFKLIRVCKEDEAIGIAAGLSYRGIRALVLIQHTGFLDSVNAVRAVPCEYNLPVCMMIGLLNREPDVPPRDSKIFGVKITEPILDAMSVRHDLIETDADVARIAPAIDEAYKTSRPTAILIGRSPTAS
jgi:sulfopyruvate decarboxylase TPP-binding subunit